MVRLWPIEDTTVLRRIAPGDGTDADQGGHHGSPAGGLVRLQALEERAVLRRDASHGGLSDPAARGPAAS